MTNSIDEILRRSREAAEALAFPPFVTAESESTPLNASPYVAHLDHLREGAFLSARGALIGKFVAAVDELPSMGVQAEAALLGGSAIGPKPDPGDLDCVLFYSALPKAEVSGAQLRQFGQAWKARQIDLRLMPTDGDIVLLLKTVSFFSMLYSKNASDLTIRRGLVLIDCRNRPKTEVV